MLTIVNKDFEDTGESEVSIRKPLESYANMFENYILCECDKITVKLSFAFNLLLFTDYTTSASDEVVLKDILK